MDDFQDALFLAEEKNKITLAKKKQHERAKRCNMETLDQSIKHSTQANLKMPWRGAARARK
jgi:hypothetical protein